MIKKYIEVSSLKRKLNHVFRSCGVAPQMREEYKKVINSLPYIVMGEIETTLESQWHHTGTISPVDEGFYLGYYKDLVTAEVLEWYNGEWYHVGKSGAIECRNAVFWTKLPELPKENTAKEIINGNREV